MDPETFHKSWHTLGAGPLNALERAGIDAWQRAKFMCGQVKHKNTLHVRVNTLSVRKYITGKVALSNASLGTDAMSAAC